MKHSVTTNGAYIALHNVRAFGASGNGIDKDTDAIQKCIDACSEAGGGVVYCPPGTYLSGTILLKNDVELHLEAGATLLGSPNRSDYIALFGTGSYVRQNGINFNYDEHLVCAHRSHNIAITGRGTIDGNGRAFFGPKLPGQRTLSVRDWRPGQLVTFIECQDVLLRDVNLIDSPSWSVWPQGCERVRIEGIQIRNNRDGPNCDGINPICCNDVRISDCDISAGDDCIAVYSMSYFLDDVRSCENIVVTNCVLSTPCNGVRVGYTSDWPIRNCIFTNLVMSNTRTGINMLCTRSTAWKIDREYLPKHGPIIENVSFENIIMDTRRPIYLWVSDNVEEPGCIRNVNISGITATSERASYVGGSRRVPIRNLSIRDMRVTMRGDMPDRDTVRVPYPYPEYDWNTPGLPYAFYSRYVRGLGFHDVRIEWDEISGTWLSALHAEHVDNLDLDGVIASQAPNQHAAPALRLTNVNGAFVRGCRAAQGTSTFLCVDGKDSAHIAATGNDLGRAQEAFRLAAETPAEVFQHAGNILPQPERT